MSAAVLPDIVRLLRPVLTGAGELAESAGATLERLALRAETPLVATCIPLEAPASIAIVPASEPLVRAFLDGVQRSRVVAHVDGAPLVVATVGAAVRERIDRTLQSWGAPQLRRVLLASRMALGDDRWAQLLDRGVPLVDLDGGEHERSWHPYALRARALELVGLEREQLERQLAAAWCAQEDRWLWIDGGVSGNLAIDERSSAFGVVKSHNTLYGDAAAVRRVLALREGERSSAFLIGHRARRAVASWYLRWRAPLHGDPLFGLLRIELSPPPALLDDDCPRSVRDAFTTHCNRLSSAILLERSPVSLPDSRWDTLAYGVHAVENYLQALIGP